MATTQNFTLKFQADVSQAKKAVQDLNNSLKAVTNANFSNSGISLELEKASIAAQELRTHLMTATNASTGKLNLNDFNRSITASKTNLSSLLQNLANGGQAGQQAFMSFATAIAQSEVPLRKVNTRLASIGTTLKNTIKWQLSSSLINSFVRGISSAIGYVKDLNSSLNDIRIVTGKSVEEMAQFAEQANKAARELSTTTKAYTDASLIYYQQGESAEMAAKKAAITIKAANASFGSSAKEMSEYLTAVWNSFQVGADELERYVDIMAALGANTATSMEEIATSMQKVAATANTVGVSMEQISSIISTVSSVTRESAESIGTSYKTILARIGDLKLGKTLEDGVGLGQVSSELDKIGVKVLDATGEMRDMGAIIEDIGSKWQNMGRAQQTALAQVVAGKRQYTQFMALFENWDKYQKNMNIASNSSGSLQNMQDTFTESWEGASKRLRASLENIWSGLMNDEAMIKFVNVITKITDGIGGFIKALGGAKGTLQTFGALGLLVFQKQITNSVIAATASVKNFFTQKNEASQYIENLNKVKTVMNEMRLSSDSTTDTIKIDHATKLIELKETLAQKESKLNDLQKQQAQAVLSSYSEEMNLVSQLGAKYDELNAKAKQRATEAKANALAQAGHQNTAANDRLLFQQRLNNFTDSSTPESMKALYTPWMQHFIMGKQGVNSMSGIMGLGQKMGEDLGALDNAIQRIQQLKSESQTTGQTMSGAFSAAFKSLETAAGSAAPQVRKQIEDLKVGIHTMSPDEISQKFTNLVNSIMRIQYGVPSIDMMVERLRAMGIITDENEQDFREIAAAATEAGQALDRTGHAADDLTNRMNKSKDAMQNTKTGWNSVLNGFQTAAAAAMSFSAAITAAQNTAKNWDDGNLTSKISGIASSMSSVAMLAGSGAKIGGPWGAAIGAGVGILASIGGAIAGRNEAKEEKRKETLTKRSEDRKEAVETLQNENTEINKLLSNYTLLNASYQSSGEVTDELISATKQLAEAYGLVDSAVISTTSDLENLQEQISMAALQQLLESRDEYEKQLNLGYASFSNGFDLRDTKKAKTLEGSLSGITYTEKEMIARAAEGLTYAEEEFYQAAQKIEDTVYGGDYGADNAFSTIVNVTEPLENWVVATKTDLETYFEGSELLENITDVGALASEKLFYVTKEFTEEGENIVAMYKKTVDGFKRITDPSVVTALDDTTIILADGLPTITQKLYSLGELIYSWTPDIEKKSADLHLEKVDHSWGSKFATYDFKQQFLGLQEYFGMGEDENTAKNIAAVLNSVFSDSTWGSAFDDYINTLSHEQQIAWTTLKENMAKGAYETVSDLYDDLFGSGLDFDSFKLDNNLLKKGGSSVLEKAAEQQYQQAQIDLGEDLQKVFGEDFSFDSLLKVNEENLFGTDGKLIWDSLTSGDAIVDQYIKLQAASKKIAERRQQVADYIQDMGIEEGSPEYEYLQQVLAELDKIDTIYQEIIGEETLATKTLSPLIAAREGMKQTDIAVNLRTAIKNGEKSDAAILAEVIATTDQNASLLNIQGEKGSEEYYENREAFIKALVDQYAADLGAAASLYLHTEEVLRNMGHEDQTESYMEALLGEEGFKDIEQLSGSLLSAVTYAVSNGLTSNQLINLPAIQDALNLTDSRAAVSDAKTELNSLKNASEQRTSNASAAQTLYNMLFDENEKANAELFDKIGLDETERWDYSTFIAATKTEQDEYLEKIQNKYGEYISGLLESMLNTAPTEGETYGSIYEKWSTDAKGYYQLEEADVEGEYHAKGYADIRNAGYSLLNNELYLKDAEGIDQKIEADKMSSSDLSALTTLLREQAYQQAASDVKQINSELKADDIMDPSTIDTFANNITVLEKNIEDLENEADVLSNIDIESMPKAGTAAYEALNKALQKTGKSMNDYIKMSAKDKTRTIGNAQINNLQNQKKEYEKLAQAYTSKYSDFATTDYATILASGDEAKISAYEAYLEAIQTQQEIEQEIVDTQEQTAENLIAIGAANTDAAIALFQAEQEKLKDAADKLQEVAQILSENIETGFLTYEQQSKMSAEQLATWRSKTTQNERAEYATQIAQQATQQQLDYQATINENISKASEFMTNRAGDSRQLDNAKFYKDSDSFKNYLDDQNIDKGIRDALITADSAVRSTLGSDATVAEWGDAMRKELNSMGLEGKETLSTLSAEGKDLMAEIWVSAANEAKEAAESAYENWVNAFEQIADARAKLLSGENLIEDIAGNPELLAQYAKNAGIDPKELSKMIMSGSVTADTFDLSKSKTEYINAEKTKYGLDLVNSVGNTVGTVGRANDALAFGLDNTTLDSKATQEALAERYQAILEASNLYGAEAANIAQQLAAGQGDYSLLTAARQHLISAIEGAAEAQEVQRQQTEDLNAATTASDNVIENGLSYGERQRHHLGEQYEGQSQERLTSVNEAIANLQEEKYREDGLGSITNLSAEDQAILGDFGINMNNVDSAAQNTAKALAILAQAAYDAATAQYEEGQVTENADGTVTVTNSEGGEDVEASEKLTELRQNADAANFAAQDVPDNTTQLQASSIGMTVDEFQAYQATLQSVLPLQSQFDTSTKEGQDALAEYALKLAQMDEGLQEIEDTSKDTWDLLGDKTKKGTKDWTKNMESMRVSVAKAFGKDTSEITQEFVEKHLDNLRAMSEGTEEEAIKAQDAIQDDLLKTFMEAEDIDMEKTIVVNADTGEVSTAFDYLSTALDQWDGEEFGFTIHADTAGAEADVIAGLNSILAAGAMTADQISAALGSISWAPEITWDAVSAEEYAAQNMSGGYELVDGTYVPISGSVEGTATETVYIPRINSMSKIASPAGGAKKSGGGGGGGGGGNKQKHDRLDARGDRYHEVKENLARISENLEEIEKAKNRTYGKNHLENLEKENELLQKQRKEQERYLEEILGTADKKGYLQIDLEAISGDDDLLDKFWEKFGVDEGERLEFEFDAEGNISNWEEIMEKVREAYNAKADVAMTDEQWEKYEEIYQDLIDGVADYEETLALANEQGLELQDILDAIQENNLTQITYKVEYQMEINEGDLELLDYYAEVFEDELGSFGELMTVLTEQASETEDNLSIIQNGINELNTAYQEGKINQAQYQQALADFNSQLIDNLSELEAIEEQIQELYADALDKAQEEFEKHTSKLEYVANMMQKYADIFQLLGKSIDRDYLDNLYDVQIAANKQSIASQKALYDELLKRKQAFEAKAQSEEGLSETEQKEYEALMETFMEVHENMLDTVQETLDAMRQQYENAIESIFAKFEENMLGAGWSLQGLADSYAYYQTVQERQLSAAQEIYQMSKLNRQIEQSIEDATTKANKQLLKDLQAQINARAELNELTQYDIDMMDLQYQMALKKMALEEAQAAKSVVRLTRDNDGNYAYQYTADEDQVNQAYQEYEDVLAQINDLATSRVGELESAMLDAQQEYTEKLKELALDETLTEEEKMRKKQELYEQYQETLLWIQEQYEIATGDLQSNLGASSAWYHTTITEDSDIAKEKLAAMIQNAGEWVDAYWNLINGEDHSISSAFADYAAAIAEVNDIIDTLLTEEGANAFLGMVDAAGQGAAGIVNVLSGELDEINDVTAAWEAQRSKIEELKNTYQALAGQIQAVITALAELPEGAKITQEMWEQAGQQGNRQGTESERHIDHDYPTPVPEPEKSEEEQRDEAKRAEEATSQTEDQKDADKDKEKREEEYTKSTGSGGTTATMVTELTAILDAKLQALLSELTAYGNAEMVVKDSTIDTSYIQQEVEINAEFPNVEHMQDIKDAIDMLINEASQRAGRNRP